jgi:quercetin dioxygenase-like cupin family protein
MKTVKMISEGVNYSAVSVGKMNELREHQLTLGPNMVINGKVFVGQNLKTTGAEMSFQCLATGEDSGFLHTHKSHEELYIIVKGNGEYQVDGDIFPVVEGSIVRVAPNGKRALKNTGEGEMVMICIQYKADSFGKEDMPSEDGVILNDELKW